MQSNSGIFSNRSIAPRQITELGSANNGQKRHVVRLNHLQHLLPQGLYPIPIFRLSKNFQRHIVQNHLDLLVALEPPEAEDSVAEVLHAVEDGNSVKLGGPERPVAEGGQDRGVRAVGGVEGGGEEGVAGAGGVATEAGSAGAAGLDPN